MIKLSKDLYIAKGAERACYLHPNDNKKIIKVEFNNNINRNQNDLDIYYYDYLKSKNISYSHIPRCYGSIETNRGKGIIVDAVRNYDGTFSKTFEYIVIQKKLPKNYQKIIRKNYSKNFTCIYQKI